MKSQQQANQLKLEEAAQQVVEAAEDGGKMVARQVVEVAEDGGEDGAGEEEEEPQVPQKTLTSENYRLL